ncbi:MAG: hypothetical protein HQK51_18475 [Oligoflexia bacterium]|nr:hypothetical protein [Oligoflexia bacterium]
MFTSIITSTSNSNNTSTNSKSISTIYEVKSFPLLFYWKKGLLTIIVVLLITIFTFVVLKGLFYAILAALVVLLPLVNFIFPSRTIFHSDYAIKEQLLLKKTLNYNSFDDIVLLEDGIFFYKKEKGAISFVRKTRSEYIYIFDNNLKNTIFNFIKNKNKK